MSIPEAVAKTIREAIANIKPVDNAKACPFCGNDVLRFETIDSVPRPPISVVCSDCDAWGPSALNPIMALKYWNGRQ